MDKQLIDDWMASGVRAGDTLLLHSDITKTVYRYRRKGIRINEQSIMNSLLECLGENGTLLLPLFNFTFTSGTPFDLRNTPSQMGALTEYARKHTKSIRTRHPIYSFAVIGQHKDSFLQLNNISGYANDSPFGLLRKLNGKIAALNLDDQHCMTFYHHVEEVNQVDYRYHKTFTAPYIDNQGHEEIRTYGLYVRDLERGVTTYLYPTEELLWQQGLYQGSKPTEGTGMRTINAQAMFDFVTTIIQQGKAENKLYRIEGKKYG